MIERGKAYLVGAGPGDPGLLTVRGLELVKNAEVLIYDRLVNERILQHADPQAEIIYVGKQSSRHTMPQEDINQVMVDKARAGHSVVRLKGGDPLVFGRGGEEALFLREHGIEFEIVPGVTSAIAAPAYAGIPVTHRDCTSTLAIITGHEKPGKQESSIAWDKIATGAGTLVFLMGVENLPEIVDNLQANGRTPATPIALVRWGTLPGQEVLSGTLETIVQQVETTGFTSPAVIVVGEVVELREQMRWFDNRPLFGKKIVVTRARAQASKLVSALESLGADVIEFPAISIQPIPSPELERAVRNIDTYAWLIFTSVNGVRECLAQMAGWGLDVRDLKGPRVCAIGPATAGELEGRGIKVTVVPEEFKAEGIVEALRGQLQPGDRVLLPRARGAREILPQALGAMEVAVDEIEIYEAAPGKPDQDLLRHGPVDVVTFTSSSTVKNFVEILGAENVTKIKTTAKVACIGPITADTARAAGFEVHIEAQEYTIDGLVDALIKYYGEGNSQER